MASCGSEKVRGLNGDEACEENKRVVCVTGANGYIGSWLVMRLLEHGYYVHGTVRDPEDPGKVGHLLRLPGASEKLKLFKADLNDEMAFDDAVSGCQGVFHVAKPVNLDSNALQGEVVGPAVRGTVNLLRACERSGTVKRVIHTSSVSAVRFTGKPDPPDTVLDESHWTSVEYCRKTKMVGWMYYIANTYAEEGAHKFGSENKMDVISILPAITVGDFLTPQIPGSVATLMALPKGDADFYSYTPRVPYVHIEDVVRAFIFLYEHPDSKGRYICSLQDVALEELAQVFQNRHQLNVPAKFDNLRSDYIYPCVDSGKLKKLGFEYKYSLEDIVDDAVKSYKRRGLF
eukprot:PITA_31495